MFYVRQDGADQEKYAGSGLAAFFISLLSSSPLSPPMSAGVWAYMGRHMLSKRLDGGAPVPSVFVSPSLLSPFSFSFSFSFFLFLSFSFSFSVYFYFSLSLFKCVIEWQYVGRCMLCGWQEGGSRRAYDWGVLVAVFNFILSLFSLYPYQSVGIC